MSTKDVASGAAPAAGASALASSEASDGHSVLTKAEIVQAVYDRVGGFSKKECADLVDLVFETMKETLGRAERLKVSGFGNFTPRDKRARLGRNPQTGGPLTIEGRRVLSFKPSQVLKEQLNQPPHAPPHAAPHAGAGLERGQASSRESAQPAPAAGARRTDLGGGRAR